MARANNIIETIAGIWGKGSDRVPKRRQFKILPLAWFWYGSDRDAKDDLDMGDGSDFGGDFGDFGGDGGGGE